MLFAGQLETTVGDKDWVWVNEVENRMFGVSVSTKEKWAFLKRNYLVSSVACCWFSFRLEKSFDSTLRTLKYWSMKEIPCESKWELEFVFAVTLNWIANKAMR